MLLGFSHSRPPGPKPTVTQRPICSPRATWVHPRVSSLTSPHLLPRLRLPHLPRSPACSRLHFVTPCRSSIPAPFASRRENTCDSSHPCHLTQFQPTPLFFLLIFTFGKSIRHFSIPPISAISTSTSSARKPHTKTTITDTTNTMYSHNILAGVVPVKFP